jgi:hypothetical protein
MSADIVKAVYVTASVLNDEKGEICDGKFEIIASFSKATRMSEE